MAPHALPPRLADIQDGSVTWQRLDDIDYELLGYFLSCHLIIEHYLDQFLKVLYRELDWDASKQTFGQKIALLTRFKMPDKYQSVPAIKHLNVLRNKISHRIDFKITTDDLLPLAQYLKKTYQDEREAPSEPRAILEEFTTMSCVFFAGYISSHVARAKSTKNGA